MTFRLEDLVIDAARERPEALAVKDQNDGWTYRELDAWSARVAGRLADLSVGPGDRVAVWAPKSCRAIAVWQAALRVGAAYVPIDSGTPAARAQMMADDCRVKLVATTRTMGASLSPDLPQLVIDDTLAWQALESAAPRSSASGRADDLAYILYTSGSTGAPKGVCISHRNALAFVEWAVDAVGIREPQVFANHASFNFDLSVFDLYGAFLTRGSVCLVPDAVMPAALALVEFVRANGISVWYSVPSALVLMIEHGGLFDRIQQPPHVVIFAGEPFPIRYLRMLRERWPCARMFNFYGPTETNVCASFEVVDMPAEDAVPVPIGAAASADHIWAVKTDGTVARQGEQGELYVEGPTVMLGYWGRERHAGPYRTGDICELHSGGCYRFIGRLDDVIKRRGHRIEPGEIEAALRRHPNVRDVAVVATGTGADQRLVACVVPRAAQGPTLLELKAFGAQWLPRYMLVDAVRELHALPRTPNGKVDRRDLLRVVSASSPAPLPPG